MKWEEALIVLSMLELKRCTKDELSKRHSIWTLNRYLPWLVKKKILHSRNKWVDWSNYVKMYEIHNEYYKELKKKCFTNKALGMSKKWEKSFIEFHSEYPASIHVDWVDYEYVPWFWLIYQWQQLKTKRQRLKDCRKLEPKEEWVVEIKTKCKDNQQAKEVKEMLKEYLS
jgi:hypothetical protein